MLPIKYAIAYLKKKKKKRNLPKVLLFDVKVALYAVGFEPHPFHFYPTHFIKAPFIQKILIPHPFEKYCQ